MIIKNWVEIMYKIMYISHGKKISSNAKKIFNFKSALKFIKKRNQGEFHNQIKN